MNDLWIILLIFAVIFSPVIYQLFLVLKEHKKEVAKGLNLLKKVFIISSTTSIIVVICILILSNTNYLDYEKPITFNRYDEITFKNFRGIELFKKSLYGNKRFAYVVTSIKVDKTDKHIEVNALFHPSKSFVYNKHTNSKELLTHEKYHIKITEIFARRIRKKIIESNFEDIDKIISEEKNNEREFQQQYDYDTFHSYVYEQQKKYEKEVDSLLNLLSDYKKSKIHFNE